MSRKDRKFKRFIRQTLGDLQKKKKKNVFAKVQSDFSAEIQNSNVFSAQNQVISKKKKKKKKKVFANFQSDFSAEFQNSNVFSAQNQVISKKKKGLRQNSRRFFFQNFASSNVSGGALFAWGGLFSIFHRKSASKAQKTCNFAYFTSQWGGLEPPPGYATDIAYVCKSGFSALAHIKN